MPVSSYLILSHISAFDSKDYYRVRPSETKYDTFVRVIEKESEVSPGNIAHKNSGVLSHNAKLKLLRTTFKVHRITTFFSFSEVLGIKPQVPLLLGL